MSAFEVEGGRRLRGDLHPEGAKNEALQVLAATLLTPEEVTIHNVPEIIDVKNSIEILKGLGVEVEKLEEKSYRFRAKAPDLEYMGTPEFQESTQGLRGSVMLVGPLLARFGKAYIPRPGGDKIGRRRLDTHFIGFQKLGAAFEHDARERTYQVNADRLQGTYMLLDEASVTGTANIIMAAVLATGTTRIYNAACEPYIQQLCHMLNRMGAKISGVGSNLLNIEGVKELGGCEHTLLPDMIEVGSFIGLAAMTRSDITVRNVGWEQLGSIPEAFESLGIHMERNGDDLRIPEQESYEIDTYIDGSIMSISDGTWPAFTPDLLSIVMVAATQAKGSILIHQKMFESRLFFVDKLIDMGARIILCDPHRATVIGLGREHPLRGIEMTSPDIRAGVSLLIAAMSAEGTSIIHNIDQIDRGYHRIDERLNRIGAKILRKEG